MRQVEAVGSAEGDGPSKVESHLVAVARGGALNLIGAIASAVCGFLLVVVVTNSYDEHEAGLLFSSVSIFLIAVSAASLGTDTGLARFILPMLASGDSAGVRRIVGSALRWTTATSVVLALVGIAGADPVRELIGLDRDEGATYVRILAAALPFAVLGDFWLGCTRACGRMRPTVALDNLLRTVTQIVMIAIAGAAGLASTWLAVGWAAPYLVVGVLAWQIGRAVLNRTVTASEAHPPTVGSDDGPDPRRFWQYTGPRAIARVSQIALQRIDIVLVAIVLGAADAAVYTAATRFVVLGQFASQAIQRVLQPRFSKLLAIGDPQATSEVFRTTTAWGMILSWPLYAIAAGLAPAYLSLFGSGYADGAVPVVVTMAAAMMFAIAAGPLDTFLLMAGRSSTSLMITVGALAIDVVGCVVLLPSMGILGAAVAWAAAILVRNAATYVVVRRVQDVSPFSIGSTIVAVASLLVIALPLALLSIATGGSPPFLALVAVTAFCLLGYCGVLYFARDALSLTSLRAVLPRRFR